MSFPKYPAYKDSGVEWLGEVPEHWKVSPLKWLAEQITDKATKSDFQVGLENIEGWTGRFIETDAEFAGDGISFQRKDILFGKLRPYLAKAWRADKKGQAVGDFFVLRPRQIDCDFLHKYILSPSVIADLNASTIGAKMPRVGWEDMAALAVTLPPLGEQTQIAHFLDHETARIDALIAEQQRLIKLLKEKRQAVISHAVTKGLDPTVPMKESEINYLDKSPVDWRLRRLGDVAAFSQGKAHEPYIDDDGDYICVNSRFVSTEGKTKKYCSANLTPAALNDILMVMSDLPSGRALARTYFVLENDKYAVNQRVCRITAEQADSRFLFYLLNRHPGLMQNDDGVHQTHLSNSDFQKLKFFLPPLEEQSKIAHYLDKVTVRIDTLISEAFTGVEFLQERRSALISAAVTGKIDVRGWQPATADKPMHEPMLMTEPARHKAGTGEVECPDHY